MDSEMVENKLLPRVKLKDEIGTVQALSRNKDFPKEEQSAGHQDRRRKNN